MQNRWWIMIAGGIGLLGGLTLPAQNPPAQPVAKGKPQNDTELVERLIATRKEYQLTLEKLREYYKENGDAERLAWVEDELRNYHRIVKYAYRLQLDVPVPTLQAKQNIPAANELFRDAMKYKDKGFGNDYVDNQRRAEILFQRLLDRYPESDKIADTAYQLGDIYEKYRPTAQPRRAAIYFERAAQWNKTSATDARMRAAKLYDRVLSEREKAKELYREVTTHDTDNRRVEEAKKRLEELR